MEKDKNISPPEKKVETKTMGGMLLLGAGSAIVRTYKGELPPGETPPGETKIEKIRRKTGEFI